MQPVEQEGSIQEPIYFCSYDNNPASWFTDDLLYVCDEHREGQEVFPLDQAPVLTRFPYTGIDILRRARKIDQVCEILKGIPSQLEQTLIAAIEKDFRSAMDALSKSKERLASDLQRVLAELSSELGNIIDTLEGQKFEEAAQTSGTWLEKTILALPLDEIREKIQSEQWVLYSRNREALRSLEEHFCCIRRFGTLLDLPPSPRVWKDQYYCLPGSKLKILDVLTKEIFESVVDLQYREGEVSIALPDGRVFFCGNESTTDCRQLNSEFTEVSKIGHLQIPRSSPGIVCFEGSVYVFGGMNNRIPLKSIEAFNLHTRSSVLLPVQMCSPRYCFCPCVWNRRMFYGPGRGSSVIEVFDPVETLCRIAIRAAESIGSVLIAVSEEEILVLAADVARFYPNDGRMEALTNGRVDYYSPGGIVSNSGKVYFALRKESHWSVQFLDESKKVVEMKDISD